MKSHVLDASVAAKWFLPEAGEALVRESLLVLADYTRGRIRLQVPDLFWPEVGSIAWKAVRQGRMRADDAAKAIRNLNALALSTAPSPPYVPQALAIATRIDRSVYDCMYVALAVESRSILVTADERLANALAAQLPVRWLGAW